MVSRGNICDKCVRNCWRFHQKENSLPTIPACLQPTFGRDFSKFLYLSPALARKLKHLDGRNIRIEDSLGDVWRVKLAYVGKDLAFREGWQSFYQDHGLHEGHKLEVQYINESHFVVRIFNRCGFEKLKFNNGKSPKTKRSERKAEKVSKDEFIKTAMDDRCMIGRPNGCFQEENRTKRSKRSAEKISKDEFFWTPIDDSCMIGRDNGCSQEESRTKRSKRNAEKISKDEFFRTPMDDSCMIGRDNGCIQEENRIFLDLEVLERLKETSTGKSVKALDAKMAPDAENADYSKEVLGSKINPFCSETTLQAEITGDYSQTVVISEKQINRDSGGVIADEMEKGLGTNEVPPHADLNKKLKIATIDTNQVNGKSGGILTDEFGNALEMNVDPNHTGTYDQSKITGDNSKLATVDRNQMTSSSGEISTDEFAKALEKNVVRSYADINEQSKIKGDDSKMRKVDTDQMNSVSGEILIDESVKVLEMNVITSHANIKEQSKIKGDDSKMAKVATNEINGNSGGICTDKFEKSFEMKASPFHIGSSEHNKTMVDDVQMVVNQTAVIYRDTFTDNFHFEPSAISNSAKGINSVVSKLQNDGESLSIGISKMSRRESAVKHNFSASSFFSSKPKDGKCRIKREQVELGEEVKSSIGFSCEAGKGLPVGKKCAKIPPIVKVEPDLSPDDCCISFSAEVKTLSYLELPVRISSVQGRRDKGLGKLVYLRDSVGRLWPVLFPDKYSINAFTANWTNFCRQNNIKPGDECSFHREPTMMFVYRVNVTRRFAAYR